MMKACRRESIAKNLHSHGVFGLGGDFGVKTSTAIESINGIIQTARRRARAFRKFENLKAISYWMSGRLDLKIPPPFTHSI